MTTKQQAKDLVDLNASDEQIVRLTGCAKGCVDSIRAWGRGERVEWKIEHGIPWLPIYDTDDPMFSNPARYRIAPRLIRATAELPDGRTVEVEWPEPVREPPEFDRAVWLADLTGTPVRIRWNECWLQELDQGRPHLTREAALQHNRAMRKLNGGEVE